MMSTFVATSPQPSTQRYSKRRKRTTNRRRIVTSYELKLLQKSKKRKTTAEQSEEPKPKLTPSETLGLPLSTPTSVPPRKSMLMSVQPRKPTPTSVLPPRKQVLDRSRKPGSSGFQCKRKSSTATNT
jgi:hypothetical protein